VWPEELESAKVGYRPEIRKRKKVAGLELVLLGRREAEEP